MKTMRSIGRTSVLILAGLGLCLSLNACASMGKTTASTKGSTQTASTTTVPDEDEKISLSHLFGGGKKSSKSQAYDAQSGIGVNAYLWRASLDTLAFMPTASADPWGGVIITDWYANPEKPDERFKATIYILDSRLRADALNVSVFKQVQTNGQWTDAEVSQQTQLDLENAILDRARELRHSDIK